MAIFEKKESGMKGDGKKTIISDPSFLHIAERTLKRPRLTEKAFVANEINQYVFQVAKDATKDEVRRAVEYVYGVSVEKVRTVTIPPKVRNFGRFQGLKSGMKKAIVTLPKGEELPIFKSAE